MSPCFDYAMPLVPVTLDFRERGKSAARRAVPSGADCEPWQRQSQQRSKLFQCKWQSRF